MATLAEIQEELNNRPEIGLIASGSLASAASLQTIQEELDRRAGAGTTEFPELEDRTRAVSELPELSDVGVGSFLPPVDPTFKGVTTGIGKGLLTSAAALSSFDVEEVAQILKANNPAVGISFDPGGNVLVTNNDTGLSAVINKPGFSKTDVLQLGGAISAFTPAGAGLKGITKEVATKLALRSGATETALQTTQAAAGGEFDVSDIAIVTGAAPLGQLVGVKAVEPVINKIVSKFANTKTTKLLSESAPSIQELKIASRKIYDQIDEMGTKVAPKKLNRLIDDIVVTLKKEGLDVDLTPKAAALLKRLQSEKGKAISVTELDTLYKVASGVARDINASDSRLGIIALDKMDNFLDGITAKDLLGNKSAGSFLKQARDLWGRSRRGETIQTAITLAGDQASGFENGLRTQFRSILRRIDTGKLKGFSKEEIEAMRIITKGTTAANIAKQLGKFGISQDQATNSLMVGLGGAGGFAFGGGPGAVAVPLIGTVSRVLSEKLTTKGAGFADDIVRAGPDAKKVVAAYMKNIPKDQRNVAELTELLMQPRVNLTTVKTTGNKLVDDAVFFATNLQIQAAKQINEGVE